MALCDFPAWGRCACIDVACNCQHLMACHHRQPCRHSCCVYVAEAPRKPHVFAQMPPESAVRTAIVIRPLQVFQWANERPPDPNSPLDCYADSSGGLRQFVLQRGAGEGGGGGDGMAHVVQTVSVQVCARTMSPCY
jgi:hypothetical protein